MTWEQLFIYLRFLIITAANAAADGIMIRWITANVPLWHHPEVIRKWSINNILDWRRDQWFWHIFKWIFFYSPLLWILYELKASISVVIFLGILCYYMWSFIYNFKPLYKWIFKETTKIKS